MGDDSSSNRVGGGRRGRLPPGFRFDPSDEELVVHFLRRKASLLPICRPDVIPDLELYPYDPWQLRGKALEEGDQWYFFSRKAPRSGGRRTDNGYWKKTHQPEQPIFSKQRVIGMKRHYAFYIGELPSGVQTNWIMDEYSLSYHPSSSSSSSSKRRGHPKMDHDKWVVCRVYEQRCDDEEEHGDDGGIELSCLDEVFLSLEDELDDVSYPS